METRLLRAVAALVATLVLAGAAPGPALADDRDVFEPPVFELPVTAPLIRGFDPPEHRWLAGHRGVDLRVERGWVVRSAGPGVVAFAGVVVDRPLVSIDHPVGIRTTYEPVDPLVAAGEDVARGQPIGVVHGGGWHCEEPCLHWGARIGPDHYLDPMNLLTPPRYRLFPPEPW